MQKIAVLITCHNRIHSTMNCLSNLYSQSLPEGITIIVYLVDDGSTDGTAEAVKKKYPNINLLEADGTLFWNRGMHLAFGEALKSDYDYYLWLNDDTYLYQDAIKRLISTYGDISKQGATDCIVIASTRDSVTQEFTYGGYRRANSFINPLRFRLVPPDDEPKQCDSMCGNCVLIPKKVSDVIGNIDSTYMHRWGDADYGLRAVKRGFQIWICSGYLADCNENPNADRWRDKRLSLKMRYQELNSLKGLGKRDWFRFVRAHGGVLWPLIWVRPYIKLIYDSL